MTTERDARTRTVLSWLREDAHENAERVLLRALDEVDTTPQRRPFWSAWRFLNMNSPVRYAVAAAAVLAVALVGYQLLPSNIGSSGGQRTPSPSLAPSPAPTAPVLPSQGPVNPGTYRMGTGPTFLITIPSGWVSNGGMSLRKHIDQPNEVALDVYGPDIRVFADACDSEGTDAPIGPTADDLIAALEAQENSEVSEPVDITVAGLPGIQLEISAPAGLDFDQCSIGSLQIWVDEGAGGYLAGIFDPVTVHVADTPDGRLLFVPHQTGAASAPDVAERDAMIASIQLLEE